MIEKAKVGAAIENYEEELKKEIAEIEAKLDEMDAFVRSSAALERVWRESQEYTELATKKTTLQTVLFNLAFMKHGFMKYGR